MNSQQHDDDDDSAPLTKPKGRKVIISEVAKDTTEQLEQVKKPRKKMPPKTEKQMQQFQVAMQKRKESIENKKLEKKIEASKLLLQYGITPTPQNTPVKQHKTKKVVEVSEESSEEEIIIKTVKKPKKKKVIKVEVSDSSDSDEPDQPPAQQTKSSSSQFRKQQYQKPSSVIKVHDNKPKYYFAD
jgi:hypothetical protein